MNNALLIVDDEPNVIRSLERQLKRENYTIYSANSGEAGLGILIKHDIPGPIKGRIYTSVCQNRDSS